ncbi:Asp-tRNA(Asn)/Glu-tRNA(Gln) amidotransferase subunit GatC [Candidatus Woesearchaeota archaeon]|nr:Asp-tRNA(Asn)/Glu-tRNA(Gln) amidotransferase subunit GatC [Candidatus Woesearchaeota archaeon]MBI2130511.1 Asp-tRNA(Asn)/Glu-tRNA(Gln) amidotransferase subunit GatC [Candidatus Woesearchaeota archaeon]MBI2661122.1 Asp-tRNA(Asn)/Glu-tRNA(Gln) amidotransferase subunit GatC [Candidatus Woesearchaeota archaeon]
MDISTKTIEHVAEIARLRLTEKEKEKFVPQLKEALEFFSKLSEVNTDNVKPSFHPVEIKNAMRDDIEGKCLAQDEALSLTEHKKDGYFKGPRVI